MEGTMISINTFVLGRKLEKKNELYICVGSHLSQDNAEVFINKKDAKELITHLQKVFNL